MFGDADSGGKSLTIGEYFTVVRLLEGSVGCAADTVCLFGFSQCVRANILGTVNNDDFVSRYRLLNDGREKTLNNIGTFDARLTC
jgi:hypothetical protein